MNRFNPFMLEHHVGRTGHFELSHDSDIYSSELSELHGMISVIIKLISSIHASKLTAAQPLILRVEPPDLTVLKLWLHFSTHPRRGTYSTLPSLASAQTVKSVLYMLGVVK